MFSKKNLLTLLLTMIAVFILTSCGANGDNNIEKSNEEENTVVEPEILFNQSCARCHGDDLAGGMGPSLESVGSRLSKPEIYDIIVNGRGAMPGGLAGDDETAMKISEWLSEIK